MKFRGVRPSKPNEDYLGLSASVSLFCKNSTLSYWTHSLTKNSHVTRHAEGL